jgi:ATP-dependent Clp protease protease subunit
VAKTDSLDIIYDYGLDLASRTVWFDDEVSDESVSVVIKSLHLLSQKAGPISIILNTPGGDVQAGLALFDFIRSLDQEVTISVYGQASSMGSIILQAADIRRISRHSVIMMHDGESTITGYNRKTTAAWFEMEKKQDDLTDEIILTALRRKNPEFTKQRLHQWLAKDTVVDARTALELGLVDKII